jgi:hypothetical protein
MRALFRRAGGVVAAVVCLFIASPVSATVTDVAIWRLGDDDTGAASGDAARSPATNLVGTLQLKVQNGAPAYTNDTNDGALSALSVSFNKANNEAYGTDVGAITGIADNYGVECWAKPNGTAWGVVLGVGTQGSPGAGQVDIAYDGAWKAIRQGVGWYTGNQVVSADTWTHVALVVSGGMGTLYVNGAAVGTGTPPGSFDAIVAGGIWWGGSINSGNAYGGLIDDVRLFTFVPGTFSPADLNYPQRDLGALDDPNISVPGVVDFGGVDSEGTSNLTVAVENTGVSSNLVISSVSLVSGDTNEFAVLEWPRTIPSGAASNIVVRYSPSAVAGHSAVMRIASDDPGNPDTDMALTGRGVGEVAMWRMGDDDPGARNGGTNVVSTKALIGSIDLSTVGNPVYSTDTPSGGSLFSMAVEPAGTDGFTASGVFPGGDNWCVECWIKVPALGAREQVIFALNKQMELLLLNDGRLGVHWPGIFIEGYSSPTLDTWTHVALVRAGGMVALYMDGARQADVTGLAPGAGTLHAAYRDHVTYPDYLDGSIDDLRIFTFGSGPFSTDLLNYPQRNFGPSKPGTVIILR